MRVVGRRSGLIPCGGPLRTIAAPGVLLIGDAAGWVSPMTGGGIRLAFKFGRRAASLIADHLMCGGPAPETVLAREVPTFRAKRMLRKALDLAPPNFLIDMALGLAPARRLAERLYFHSRNDTGIDRDAYLKWLERQRPAEPAATSGVAAPSPR